MTARPMAHAHLLAAALTVAVLTVATGCRESRRAPPKSDPNLAHEVVAGAYMANCARAVVRASGLPPARRAEVILRACPVCGQSFEPLFAASAGHADVMAVAAVVEACATGCSKRAIARWRTAISDSEPGVPENRAWRALAEDCPAPLATDERGRRFAAAPWFGLVMIGARVTSATTAIPPSEAAEFLRARNAIAIPLPPWTVAGTGMIVPSGTAGTGIAWRAITVFDRQWFVGRLAIAGFTDAGWQVDAPGPPYPGVASTDLRRDVAALPTPTVADRRDDVLIIAPRSAPAARALAAVVLLGEQSSTLAVAVPDSVALWRGTMAPHALTWRPATGPRVRIDLARGRVAAIAADGSTRAAFAVTDNPDLVARWHPVIAAAHAYTLEFVADVPDEIDTAAFMTLADDAAASGVLGLAASAGAIDDGRRAFDAAALIAALATR